MASSGNVGNVRLAPFYRKSEVREFEKQLPNFTADIKIVESAELWKYAQRAR